MPEKIGEQSKQPEEEFPQDLFAAAGMKRKIEIKKKEEEYLSTPMSAEEEKALDERIDEAAEEAEEHGAVIINEDEDLQLLPYAPFDAQSEFVLARRLSAEERALPKKERNEIRRGRLEEFKEKMMDQKIGVAKTIEELREIVDTQPGIPIEILYEKIDESAEKYKFSAYQAWCFKRGIDGFERRHAAVEKYREMYADDAELFSACFGQKPKGKIEVEKGSMTLMFRCFDEADYALIYNFNINSGGQKAVGKEEIDKANKSGGLAQRRVLIEDLAGAVIAENANSSMLGEVIEHVDKTEKIDPDGNFTCLIFNQFNDIDIETAEGSWKIKLSEPDSTGAFYRMQMVSVEKPDDPPIFDLTRLKPVLENGHAFYLAQAERPEERINDFTYEQNLKKIGEKFSVEMDYFAITIKNRSGKEITVKYTEDDFTSAFNEDASRRVATHEEQHQFNTLFAPIESRQENFEIMQRAIERTDNPDKAIEYIIHDMVKVWRANAVDTRARDEMIAYYKDGRSTGEILATLRDSELYDYAGQEYTGPKAGWLANIMKNAIEREVREVFYDEDGNELSADDLKISAQEITPYINEVFGKEYKTDLKRWIDSISVLEKKGYTRDEISALLYTEPVNGWQNLVRRIKVAKK